VGTAPVVTKEIGCDAEEVAAGGDFAFRYQRGGEGSAEVADEAFLHEVVGEGGIAGDAGEVGPERPGRATVEAGEEVAIHCVKGQRLCLRRVGGDEAGENGFPKSGHRGFHVGRGPCCSPDFPGEGRLAVCDCGGGGHEAETRRKNPGYSRRDDKSKTGHEGYDSEDEHRDLGFCCRMAKQEQAKTEENEHDSDLEGGEDTGDCVGDALLGLDAGGDGCGFKEALAGFGFHVLSELLAGAELVNEAAVDFALELEDAAPAAVFKELAEQPNNGAEETGEGEEGHEGLGDILGGAVLPGLDEFGPDGALKRFVGTAILMTRAGEEVEVWIADDFRVGSEKRGELGILLAHVFLIGEQGGVVGDDGGDGGTETEQFNELVLGGAEVFIADGGGGGGRMRRLGLGGCEGGGQCCGNDEGDDGGAKKAGDEAGGAHCEVPLSEKGLKAVLPV